MRRLTLGCVWLLIVPILVIIVIGTVANLGSMRASAAAPKLAAPTRIASWSSKGDLTTQPIKVTGSSVRLDLAMDRQVCVWLKRIDGQFVNVECRQASGPTYLYAGPGTYYLEVYSIGSWSMTATDLP